ncbi:unnamed protein product [Penicillium viridicatum]
MKLLAPIQMEISPDFCVVYKSKNEAFDPYTIRDISIFRAGYNEYHNINQTIVLNTNQAAINAIRAAGATSKYIFVKGNGYSGAWSWTTTNDNLMKDGFLFIETAHSYNPESL